VTASAAAWPKPIVCCSRSRNSSANNRWQSAPTDPGRALVGVTLVEAAVAVLELRAEIHEPSPSLTQVIFALLLPHHRHTHNSSSALAGSLNILQSKQRTNL